MVARVVPPFFKGGLEGVHARFGPLFIVFLFEIFT